MRGLIASIGAAALCLVAGIGTVQAQNLSESTADSVFGRLAGISTVRGSFVQERIVPGLSAPLDSQGRFIVSELGLYWEQTQPFRSVLIADDARLTQVVGNQTPRTIEVASDPIAASIATVFLGVFRGDRDILDEHFEMQFEDLSPGWRIRLDPVSYPLTETIRTIVLTGDAYIDALTMTGAADDELTVSFRDVTDTPSELGPDEVALYSP